MNKPLLFPLLFLLLGLGLGGCHSNDPTTGTTTVSGQVVVYQSTTPVPHADVQLYHAGTGGGYAPVGTPYPADAQGRFAFAFEAASKSGYVLRATAPPGYTTDWALVPYLTAGRPNENLLIPTFAPAWVRLQLVDEPPKNRVGIYVQGYDGPGDTFNYPRDTIIVRPCMANFPSRIIAIITQATTGTTTQKSQDVRLAPLDTVTVRIPF